MILRNLPWDEHRKISFENDKSNHLLFFSFCYNHYNTYDNINNNTYNNITFNNNDDNYSCEIKIEW